MDRKFSSMNLVIACALLVLQGCYIDLDDNGIGCRNANGPTITETRFPASFHSITNAIGANMVIRQDAGQLVEITTQESVMDDISLRVWNGELIIESERCFRNADIDIFITSPEIYAVSNIGSGDVIGENLWYSDEMFLNITGSGTIDAEIETDRLHADITGSGDMKLYGQAQRGDIRISGSGNIAAFNLQSDQQEVEISGSGNCEVTALDLLDVTISGSGNVFYKGNPSVYSDVSGSGGVYAAN